LHCPAIGIPPPHIRWSKNGDVITNTGDLRLQNGGQELQIINANINDSGMYECLASNDAGSDRLLIDLRVWGRQSPFIIDY
jgi:hemicentin